MSRTRAALAPKAKPLGGIAPARCKAAAQSAQSRRALEGADGRRAMRRRCSCRCSRPRSE
eukprot:2687288-Pleurochrysis_carterae.AAC.1